ncbi:MAG: GNAT family N-acetyltransferase [Rhizomicrobium sp.]
MTTARQPLDFREVVICPLALTAGFPKFKCGVREIDDWCRSKASERDRTNKSRVFCATLRGTTDVAGFYSLSMRGSDSKLIDAEIVRDYNDAGFVPFVYIDYLAVNAEYQRRQLGTYLLMDALRRCRIIVQNMGCLGVALHSLTPEATAWYKRFGFRERQKGATQFPLMVLPAQSLLDLPDANAS